MFAHTFRFDHARFQDRIRAAASPRKPRQRWLRIACGAVGLVLLALLVMFSVVVGAAMIAAGLLYRWWQRRGKPVARAGNVVDGEYRVVDRNSTGDVRPERDVLEHDGLVHDGPGHDGLERDRRPPVG
ncbi:hypothetical protein [Marilutibacter alkalisoli]|uniref:hypothetical protein n=1 Tax=Marilutibacter alkalisoli TaxID=2591633 RepID=UPI001ABE0279|nr:hypothetical protein [Lysobacter alkalisoli]